MLTWDEEVKPSLQNSLNSGMPGNRSMDISSLNSEDERTGARMLNDGVYVPNLMQAAKTPVVNQAPLHPQS